MLIWWIVPETIGIKVSQFHIYMYEPTTLLCHPVTIFTNRDKKYSIFLVGPNNAHLQNFIGISWAVSEISVDTHCDTRFIYVCVYLLYIKAKKPVLSTLPGRKISADLSVRWRIAAVTQRRGHVRIACTRRSTERNVRGTNDAIGGGNDNNKYVIENKNRVRTGRGSRRTRPDRVNYARRDRLAKNGFALNRRGGYAWRISRETYLRSYVAWSKGAAVAGPGSVSKVLCCTSKWQ